MVIELVGDWSFEICHSAAVANSSLFTIHFSLPMAVANFSLFTFHYSLFTIPFRTSRKSRSNISYGG